MKQNYAPKFLRIIGFILLLSNYVHAQISTGDMAIIGMNSDSSPDELTLVALAEIPPGEIIYISDYPWDGSALITSGTAEGVITWTLTNSVPAGTVIKITIQSPAGTPLIEGGLSIYGTVSASGWTLASSPTSSGGDNWFIYQGTSADVPTNWVFAWANWSTGTYGSFSWQTLGEPSSTTSFLPSALANGTNAISLSNMIGNGGGHNDNNVYTGTQSGDKASVLAAIVSPVNWAGDETTTQDIDPGGTNFTGTNPIFNISGAATTLTTGDIAFVGMNLDGTDNFSFILLKDILAGTQITFTDKGWQAAGGFRVDALADCNSENTIAWTAGSDLSVGDIVTIEESTASVASMVNGTVVPITEGCPYLNFSSGGESLFAYQGAAPILGSDSSFIAAINMNGGWDLEATTTNTSAKPAVFIEGVNSVTAASPEVDNAVYQGPLTGDAVTLRTNINNAANWNVNDSTPFNLPDDIGLVISTSTVITTAISVFDATSATMGGNVTADGGATVTERGVVYNITGTPTTSDTKVSIGTGTGDFSHSVTGFSASTTYHVRAYAINSAGTSYGNEVSFTTLAASVLLSTNPTLSFSNANGFDDNIVTDGEGGSVVIDDLNIQAYPINSAGIKLETDTVEYHDGTDWKNYPAIITYGDLPSYYGWLIKSDNGANFDLKALDFHDWGNYDGATFVIEAFENGVSKGAASFIGNTDASYVELREAGVLSSLFDDVDEIRIYEEGGNDSFIALNNIKVGSPVTNSAPMVTLVTVPANATYTTGQHLDFIVNFDGNVTVNTESGKPQLAITIGSTTRQAVYQSGSGTSTLLFRYTVQSGDLDASGIAVGTLIANGGTLKDAADNDASLTLNNVGATTGILVDALAPTVTSVSVPSNATYIAGQNLDFTVNFDENITVSPGGGTPQMSLTIGANLRQAVYVSGSGTSTLLFRYTVQSGDLDAGGIAVGTLIANGGTLKDAADNDATLILNNVGNTTGILVDALIPATVQTDGATDVTSTSVTLGGHVINGGGTNVTERGILYAITSENANPQIGGINVIKDDNSSGTGTFSESIIGLSPNTQYSYVAYAVNSKGTSYGTVKTFVTGILGLEENSLKDSILIYPSPVKNELHIKANTTDILQITLYDILGKKVKNIKLENKIINLSKINNGVYILNITTEKGTVVKKIIKE